MQGGRVRWVNLAKGLQRREHLPGFPHGRDVRCVRGSLPGHGRDSAWFPFEAAYFHVTFLAKHYD